MLREAAGTYKLCRGFFHYDSNDWYLYILDYSDKFLFGVEEDDFILDGFQIRKCSDLRKIELRDDICVEINKEDKLLAGIKKPEIDLSSWKTIFESLKKLNGFVIIENENAGDDGFFYLGFITDVKDSCAVISSADAGGEWTENQMVFYSKITSVTFNDRYSEFWREYLTKHKLLPFNQ